MPSFEEIQKMYQAVGMSGTVGENLKNISDDLMDLTWDNDIQSKKCYIYDYFHDDQKELSYGMTYENTTKTPIDAKFIVSQYGSISQDQVEYHLQFRPRQKLTFEENDDLYYFETDYHRKFKVQFPIGLYVDLPNDMGVYEKWMIVQKNIGNQFIKYSILPCNYHLEWIERDGHRKIKRKMWAVLRLQSSYNSGLWTDTYMTKQENQDKIWLPLNRITEKIWYSTDQNKNMRVLVSAYTDRPVAWKISKVENTQPIGIQKLVIYQDYFDQNKDYIEKDSNGNIIGMWADYHDSDIEPIEPDPITNKLNSEIISSTPKIKVGGTYKLLTLKIYDDDHNEITDNYSDATFSWKCSVDEEDLTEKVTWFVVKSNNQIKIKFPNDRTYLDHILDIVCTVEKDGQSFETATQYEISI
jgi:hypothetical protein|nr:MAG: hypothetical protein [Bacteriophage sp.]DAR36981.1 MAG TPA: hypothetical protein [Caudoviricetes sp.]